MLPRKSRLPSNQIAEVLKKGKQFSFPLFNLVCYQQKSNKATKQQDSCFAFVVSSKIDKRAVVRNRTKRLISEAVRLLLPQIKKDKDIIFFAKKPLKKEKLRDVLPEVEKAFRATKLLV